MEQELIFQPSEFVDVFNQTIDYAYPRVIVEGELSSFRIAKNRWVYFDIKDETATIRCFGTVYMLPGPLQDGMLVRIVCQPRLHPQFNFSLNVQSIVPVGEGALAKASELLFRKLEAEGLFAPERKRHIPYPPESIALITSVESAAYADFTKIIRARWPYVAISVSNVQVQGIASPDQIVSALEACNKKGVYDAVVIVRGGGSAEDLSAFNDERVVRAVASSRIPTMIAIGHEIDESLAELVSDMRASTPSNAAELLVPDKNFEQRMLADTHTQLRSVLDLHISQARSTLSHARQQLLFALKELLQRERTEIARREERLQLLNPRAVLARGYSLIRTKQGYVSKGSTLKSGDEIDIIFVDTTKKAMIHD